MKPKYKVIPWADAIDINPFARPLITESFSGLEDPAFGGSIWRDIIIGNIRDNGCNVDDLSWSV
jgi:hypothetical protein